MQLLNNALMARRIGTLHQAMGLVVLGILPPGWPGGGQRRQCTAAMDFSLVFLGWLVPTFIVLRSRCQAASSRRQQQQQQQEEAQQQSRQQQPQQQHSSSGMAAAGSSGSASDAGEVPGAPAAQPAQQQGQEHALSRLDAAAAWTMDNVFVADAPPELRVQAWCVLAAFCWLAAAVLPAAVAAAASPP